MVITEKIVIILAIWILISLFATPNDELDIFFVLITIGFIAIKEFTSPFTTIQIRHKLNILLYPFIIISILLIGAKIISRLFS